jgi:hypothetical protein
MPLGQIEQLRVMNIRRFFIFATFINLSSVICFGQIEISGKYIRIKGSKSNYILLNVDNSFKYQYLSDLQWDLACGQYERKGDTILFHYTSDMFDLNGCNNGKINYADTSGVFAETIDKRFRPISARLSKRTIITIKTGDIKESEPILSWTDYYIKEKYKRKRHAR